MPADRDADRLDRLAQAYAEAAEAGERARADGGDAEPEADRLARGALDLRDVQAMRAADESPAEYLSRRYDLAAGAFASKSRLRARVEELREQLGAPPTPTEAPDAPEPEADRLGAAPGWDDPAAAADDGAAAAPEPEADRLARGALDLQDLRRMKDGESPAHYLARRYDLDASAYADGLALSRAKHAARDGER